MVEKKRSGPVAGAKWGVEPFSYLDQMEEHFGSGTGREEVRAARGWGKVMSLVRRKDFPAGHTYTIVDRHKGKPITVSIDFYHSKLLGRKLLEKPRSSFDVWIDSAHYPEHGIAWLKNTPEFTVFPLDPKEGEDVPPEVEAGLKQVAREVLPSLLSPIKYAHLRRVHRNELEKVATRVLTQVGATGFETPEQALRTAVETGSSEHETSIGVERHPSDLIKHLIVHVHESDGDGTSIVKAVKVEPMFGKLTRAGVFLSKKPEDAKPKEVTVRVLKKRFYKLAEQIADNLRERRFKVKITDNLK